MKKKRLLILADWFEPAFKAGGPIRSCVNLARAMKDQFAVYVLTGDRDFGDDQPFPNITVDEWLEWEHGIQVRYLPPSRQRTRSLNALFQEVKADCLYLNSMYSLPFTIRPLLLLRAGQLKSKVVLAPRGMLQAGALQYKSFKKRLFLRLLRSIGMGGRIHWHATDQQEKSDIQQHFPSAKQITVIPNIPDTRQPPLEYPKKKQGELKIAFISRVSPKKNLLYLLEALQHISGGISLDIAGPVEDDRYWASCQKMIKKLPSNVHITYLGSANRDEVGEILKKNHIFVLPTEGENFGHAIFEALLFGKPVVISHLTPWQDLEKSGAGKLVALDASELLAEQINYFLLLDEHDFHVHGIAAWNYAQHYIRTSGVAGRYFLMFE